MKWICTRKYTVVETVRVEADSKEEAMYKAWATADFQTKTENDTGWRVKKVEGVKI